MEQFKPKKLVLEKVSKIISLIVVSLVPIFFLPITSEFFSFNKLALITLATILMILIWGIKTISGNKLEIIKSPVDKSLLATVIVVAISTIFSLNKTDSILGSQGRWLGLLAIATIVAYFYLSTPTFKDSKVGKFFLLAFIGSATISSLVSILSYYKIYLGSQVFLRFQNFSLTGSINDAIILAAFAVAASLMLVMSEKTAPIKIIFSVLLAINLFFISITGTLLGWVLLAGGILLGMFFTDVKHFEKKSFISSIIPLSAVIIPILALVIIPSTRSILVDKAYIGELTLPARESWAVATSTIRDYPTLATGVATFHLNYTRYKPLSINNTDLWNSRFDKPYNEIFNALSTIGVVGTAVAMFFGIRALSFAVKSRKIQDETGLVRISSVLLILSLASFLFAHATILNTFMLFLFLSMLIGARAVAEGDQSRSVKPMSFAVTSLTSITSDSGSVLSGQYIRYILSIPAFLIAAYLGYINFRAYAGEYFMRRSLVALASGNLTQAYNDEVTAIKFNTKRDAYYDSFATLNMTLANAVASKNPQEITDLDRQNIQTLITQALRNAVISTETLSPLNASNWETRAQIYKGLVNVAQDAHEWAINTYNTTISLDPANPRLRLELGGLYYAKGDFLSAANQFRQAISLKQDYANARYNFAMALINLGEFEQAKRELETTKLLVVKGSVDEQVLDREIENLVKKTNIPATTDKPTVEQLTGVQEAKQEPLINAGQPEQEVLNPNVLPDQKTVTPQGN